jgi:serine protease Do
MKRYQFLSVLVLIPMLVLAGCSPVGSTSAVSRLQALANEAKAAMNAPAAQAQSAPITNVVAQAATATPAALVPETGNASSAPVASSAALAAYEGTLEQIYTQVNPSVVNIQVEIGAASTSQSGSGTPFGFSQGVQQALGSGFVWDNQGHIVTNNHVVSGADKITVNFADGTTVSAKLVGADPNADLAVIQVNVPANELHPVSLTDSAQVKVGQMAIAIGNPFGLSGTMTEGIISALSRSLPVGQGSADPSGQSTGATYSIPDIIQTDAAINPGNSGGVLVNNLGQVIGVTAAIQSSTNSNSGIGFVIPANIVNKVVPSLIKTGSYPHPYLGISGVSLDNDIDSAMNLKANQHGVLIIDVSAGTPAEQAGLRGSSTQAVAAGQPAPLGGDVITAIDGHAVNGIDDLTSYLFNNTQVGQTVTLTVIRQGREQAVKLTLGALPNPAGQ